MTTSTISSSTASEDSDATPTADVEFAEEILKEHNVKRALHGVPALSWSNKLAEYAQDYANTGFDCSNLNLKHSGGPYGENWLLVIWVELVLLMLGMMKSPWLIGTMSISLSLPDTLLNLYGVVPLKLVVLNDVFYCLETNHCL